MPVRIPWDDYEIALLFEAYEQVASGKPIKVVAVELSETLRRKALRQGKAIDDTYRNVNGMMMQLSNVQHVMTDGRHGLSGASSSIKRMHDLMVTDPDEFAKIREEARLMVDCDNRIEKAFIEYVLSRRPSYTSEVVFDCMTKAGEYCSVKSKLVGILDIKFIRDIQQKVSSGGLLRFKYGVDNAKRIQDVVGLYYGFVKTYRKTKLDISVSLQTTKESEPALRNSDTDQVSRPVCIGEPPEYNHFTEDSEEIQSKSVEEKLTELITEAFPRGIRPNSVIDRKKLIRLYSARFETELDESLDIPQMIIRLGVQIGDTVKVLSNDTKIEIRELIDSIFNSGIGNVFYSELLNRHSEIWESLRVEDTDTLKQLLQAVCTEYRYSDNYLYKAGATYEADLLFAYGEDSVLSCAQVHDRLPYMDLSVIKLTLSRLKSFVWSEEGVFAKTDAVLLSDNDIEYVLNTAIPEMNSKGYMSLNQLPLQSSCELNPKLSFFAIRDAMYSRYIAKYAERTRVIATPKGKTISSYELIKDWCSKQDQITITELAEVEREITGTFHYLGGSYAAESMVRIDQDTFVSDNLISFDVAATDNAIALFVQDKLASLVQINSFTSFPDIQGYTWNLYLVESFLRRFSKRFKIDGGPAQTSYVGCISPINSTYASYEDKLAEAVVQDGISISESTVGGYLIDNKYILRRTQSQIKTICNKALKLQEQRSAQRV